MTDQHSEHELQRRAREASFDLDAVIAFLHAERPNWRRVHAVRGVTCIHEWLSVYPGETWQERWVAADGDHNVETVLQQWQARSAEPETPAWLTHAPRHSRHGLGVLVKLGLLRPGPGYTLLRNSKIALKSVLEDNIEEIESVISMSAKVVPVTEKTAWIVKYALAAMIASTGKPLAQITVEDWLNAEHTRSDLLQPYRRWQQAKQVARASGQDADRPPTCVVTDHTILSLRWAYTAAVRAGAIMPHPHPPAGMQPIPVSLNVAMSKPRTIESLLEAHEDHITGRLYDFIALVLNEWYASHDFNTRRGVVGSLSLYIRAVQAVIPGHQSLRVPRKHSAELIEYLRTRADRHDPTIVRERVALPLVLTTVRRFYEMAQLSVEDSPQYEDLIGPFPVPRQAVSMLSAKQRKKTRSRMHADIRDRITSLDDFVPAAQWLATEAKDLLSKTRATEPTNTFEHQGITYIRHDTSTHPDSRQILSIRPVDGKRPIDVNGLAHRAVRTSAFVTLLRHTGVRLEEAIEIAHEDLAFAMIDGAKVPCLRFGPGKTDNVRTIALHREAVESLVDLIRSHTTLYGHVPIATRKDSYERLTLPPRRYLFQSLHNGAFLVPGPEAFAGQIRGFVSEYNAMARIAGQPTLKPMRPHDFRRVFATDLLDKEVPIEAVRHLLGHTNISTTAIYDHTTWDRAAAKFLQAHRLSDQQANLTPCPECNGTGLVHEHPQDEMEP